MIDIKQYFLTSDYQRFVNDFESHLRPIKSKRTTKKIYSVRFGDKLFVGYKGRTTWTSVNNALGAVANVMSNYTKSWDAACKYIDELLKSGEMVIKETEIVDLTNI